jgi:gamma-glutamyl-gamma-aminobutyrate hydrolase PuuD
MAKNKARRIRAVKQKPKSVIFPKEANPNNILADPTEAPLDLLGRLKKPEDKERTKNVLMERLSSKVTVMQRESALTIPELWLTVYIAPAPESEMIPFIKFFARAKCYRAETPEDADLVVFPGGSDVDPQLYGEKAIPGVHTDHEQDRRDIQLYYLCREKGIPMLGICRGAQFLHVMNGGKLYQDVDNHNTSHKMWDQQGITQLDNVSSVHHQMVIPNNRMEIIATSPNVATRRIIRDGEISNGNRNDVEVFFYRDYCCLGIQGHPEYGGFPFFSVWSLKLIDKYINENQDLAIQLIEKGNNKTRMKPELLEKRKPKSIIIVGAEGNS